jgi:hypothetical protein
MPTYIDPKTAASALWNGMGPLTNPAPSATNPILGPGDYYTQKGVPLDWVDPKESYNDGPTIQQINRRYLKNDEDTKAYNKDRTVLPPSVLTDDKIAGEVIPPEEMARRNIFPDMPFSYGGGRHKIYTPTMADYLSRPVVPPPPVDAINRLLDLMKKK